jgi:activator of HSP90 ATPase
MDTITIRETITIDARPHDVYEMLMDETKHAQLTRGSACISREIGGTISTNNGYSNGRVIELVPGSKIVQSWSAADWPKHLSSTITINLFFISGKTKLSFVQQGVPAHQYEDIKSWWRDHYWHPIKNILETGRMMAQ